MSAFRCHDTVESRKHTKENLTAILKNTTKKKKNLQFVTTQWRHLIPEHLLVCGGSSHGRRRAANTIKKLVMSAPVCGSEPGFDGIIVSDLLTCWQTQHRFTAMFPSCSSRSTSWVLRCSLSLSLSLPPALGVRTNCCCDCEQNPTGADSSRRCLDEFNPRGARALFFLLLFFITGRALILLILKKEAQMKIICGKIKSIYTHKKIKIYK